jgi:hypothetical protein
MRTAPRLEPAPKTEPQILRDKIYAELRNIGEQAERLAHRVSACTAWLAQLPVPDDDRQGRE